MSEQKARAIGLVRGPGSTPHSFIFISPDSERLLKVGEFVTYDTLVEGRMRTVLTRVVERNPLRPYPNIFLADPMISPASVAATLGYQGKRSELFELTGEVVGYFDERLGDFINPRLNPPIGSPIYLAQDEWLSQALSRQKVGTTGAAEIGSLLSRPQGSVPIALDLHAIASRHLAIIASTGAGKSYLASVLIEEMLKPNNRAAVLVIDPHGEYSTLDEMRTHSALQTRGYRPKVRIYKPGEVKIRIGSLTMGDLRYLLPNLSDRMEYVLRLAYRRVRQQSRRERGGSADRWTLDNLRDGISKIGKQGDSENAEEGDSTYKNTAQGLLWRLDSALENNILFDNSSQVNLRELVHPGKCAVLQLTEVDQRQQQVMVAVLMRRLYEARVKTHKKQASAHKEQDFYLPYAIFTLIEEAHNFAPASSSAISTGILKRILAEGRKFGVGVGLISQRPGKLDADALSQCNTQCLLRIINPVDQARVRESVESVGQDLLRELPALTKGQAIIAGAAVNTPILCRVRQRHTTHGGADIPVFDEWLAYFNNSSQSKREREEAPTVRKRNNRYRK